LANKALPFFVTLPAPRPD